MACEDRGHRSSHSVNHVGQCADRCWCALVSAHQLNARDLQELTPDQFEQLTFLLARSEQPDAVIVRNKDWGLDARLPDPMGRLTLRGWQAKRFATGDMKLDQCEKSLRRALAFWRPLWITFVFAHDLSAIEQRRFEDELVKAYPMVRLNFWSAEEVLRRMRDTEDGQRAAVWLFERRGTLDELLATLVDKEPVEGAQAIAERQAALNQQFDNDPHLFYTAVVQPKGAPEQPVAAETVVSVFLTVGSQEVRYDLAERYPGAMGDLGGGPMLIARDDGTGEAAAASLYRAAGDDEDLAVESGLGVVWPEVPVGLRGLIPEEPMWGPIEVGTAVQAAPASEREQRLPMLVEAGPAQIGISFVPAEEPEEGWDETLVGATGGLELTMSLRFDEQRVDDMRLDWRHTLGVGTATEQLLSARVVRAALAGEEIALIGTDESREGRATARIQAPAAGADDLELLRVHEEFLSYVCEVAAWLGTPLFPEVRPSPQDIAQLEHALSLIRNPQHTGKWTVIEVSENEDAGSVEAGEVAVLQPVYVSLFGVEHYLGMQVLQVKDAQVERSGDGVRLRPRDNDTVWIEVHHPDALPAAAAENYVGRGPGRVLIRPTGESLGSADDEQGTSPTS